MKMISIMADDYVFTWHGGAYVDVSLYPSEKVIDVINVYDYAEGKPRIPFTIDALNEEITKWLSESA